ncbi:MAG: sulfatase-like hydrolase/transferase [Verrucomicrobia bacterium]|nr:sulfatase-like hydrolase/transferase [Verrucomicrobiota bacterium]
MFLSCRFLPVSLFLLVSLCTAAAIPPPPPPNIVWIIADDMSPDTAAYGLRDVKTPHLDRLATEGRRYTRAYATAPVCSSSRSAFILGTSQITTGLHAHDVENPQPLPAPYRHLPALLREAGWFVTNAAAPGTMRSGRVIKKGKTHYNFAHDHAQMFDGDDWRKRQPGQPFFAQFQITEPHRPFPIPETYDPATLAGLTLPPNYPDHPLMRRDWYAYQRSVETVDQRVGVILAQLAEAGVLDNTLVFFFADHGRPMPWGKQWLTVEGLHVPLLRVLHAAGKLDALQDLWCQPMRAPFELYDLRRDSAGLHNLAPAPAHAATVATLRRTLDAWIHSTGDRGALPDPATEPPQAEILKSKRADYQRTWQARLKTPEPTDAARLAWWEKAYGLTP